MKPQQIREVLQKIHSEVTCPKCKKKINPKDITVAHHTENTCTLSITCTPCNFTFGGQAMFQEILTPFGKKINASSRVNYKKKYKNTPQETDEKTITHILQHTKKLSDLL